MSREGDRCGEAVQVRMDVSANGRAFQSTLLIDPAQRPVGSAATPDFTQQIQKRLDIRYLGFLLHHLGFSATITQSFPPPFEGCRSTLARDQEEHESLCERR